MKRFTWSYSSLTDFEGCPYRYAAKRFYQTTKEEPTEQTLWGERVHKAFEERIRDGKEFDEGLEHYEKWARVLERLPGEKQFERKFAINARLEPCGFFSGDAYGRGVVDLLVLDRDVATIIDYKTGKKKDDETQLNLFAYFVANEYPEITDIKYRYVWLKDNTASGGQMHRGAALSVITGILKRVAVMKTAWKEENFPCFPSGLCGWCPVSECLHHYERRGK